LHGLDHPHHTQYPYQTNQNANPPKKIKKIPKYFPQKIKQNIPSKQVFKKWDPLLDALIP
jgi:hypothetical protein